MRILVVNQHPDNHFGGSEFQCDVLASELTHLGYEVIYCAVNSENIRSSNKRYRVIALKKLNPINIFLMYRKVRPDIVYWRYDKRCLLPAAATARILSIKFVYSIAHIDNLLLFKFKKWKSGFGVKTSFLILFSNIKRLILAINYFGIYLSDAVTVNNSSYLKLIPQSIKRREVIRNSVPIKYDEEYEIEPKKPYVLWVANIKREKNPEKFISLAEKMTDTDVSFVMVGAVQGSEYNNLLQSKRIPKNFIYLGKRKNEEVNNLIKECIFLVHTCSPEGFSNILIQSWLQAKPTVSLYFDPEGVIEKHRLGFFSKNEIGLESDVRNLIKDYQLRHEMGRNAKKYANNRFDPTINTQKLSRLFESIYGCNVDLVSSV